MIPEGAHRDWRALKMWSWNLVLKVHGMKKQDKESWSCVISHGIYQLCSYILSGLCLFRQNKKSKPTFSDYRISAKGRKREQMGANGKSGRRNSYGKLGDDYEKVTEKDWETLEPFSNRVGHHENNIVGLCKVYLKLIIQNRHNVLH